MHVMKGPVSISWNLIQSNKQSIIRLGGFIPFPYLLIDCWKENMERYCVWIRILIRHKGIKTLLQYDVDVTQHNTGIEICQNSLVSSVSRLQKILAVSFHKHHIVTEPSCNVIHDTLQVLPRPLPCTLSRRTPSARGPEAYWVN